MRRATLCLLIFLLAGCGDPSWIRLDISWESDVAVIIDTVEVEVVASDADTVPAEGGRCFRASQNFTIADQDAGQPYELIIASENDDWHWLAVRVGGMADLDDEAPVVRNEGLFPFPIRDDWGLVLTAACLDVDCDNGQVCDQDTGACIDSLAEQFFLWEECEER